MQVANSASFSYGKFVDELRGAFDVHPSDKELIRYTNGAAREYLRENVDLHTRRQLGAFFSDPKHSQSLIQPLTKALSYGKCVGDPACGAGDLLIECARYLPLGRTLSETLNQWSNIIFGADISEEFVKATKLRLAMIAVMRGNEWEPSLDPTTFFPFIIKYDGLAYHALFERADIVVMNPPYTMVNTPPEVSWTNGAVSSAALFLDRAILHRSKGQQIHCILPEVIRCGSRYESLRVSLKNSFSSVSMKSIGRFDDWTDIDVFLLSLNKAISQKKQSKKNKPSPLLRSTRRHQHTLGNQYDLTVGPVVPHRNTTKGPWRSLICTRTVTPWKEGTPSPSKVRFKGKLYTPPFVAIRRTSNPNDPYRAVASVVTGQKALAAENHLILAIPYKGGLKACRRLVRFLKSAKSNKQLNRRMRCRHLTIGSLSRLSLPRQKLGSVK